MRLFTKTIDTAKLCMKLGHKIISLFDVIVKTDISINYSRLKQLQSKSFYTQISFEKLQ